MLEPGTDQRPVFFHFNIRLSILFGHALIDRHFVLVSLRNA